jgi:Protein of unknown function (DUF2934)
MNETSVTSSISHEEISHRAEQIWRNYGKPEGRDEEIWLEAESQLRSERQQSQVPASETVASKITLSTPPASASESLPPRSAPKASEMMEGSNGGTSTPRPKPRSPKNRQVTNR